MYIYIYIYIKDPSGLEGQLPLPATVSVMSEPVRSTSPATAVTYHLSLSSRLVAPYSQSLNYTVSLSTEEHKQKTVRQVPPRLQT
jgi:hypothetical protein